MVESIANPLHGRMEIFSGHSAERRKPVCGIDPNPFSPIYEGTSLRSTLLVLDDHMAPLSIELLACRNASRYTEPLSIPRDTLDETFQQVSLRRIEQTTNAPYDEPSITILAKLALKTQRAYTSMATFPTAPNDWTII